MGRNELILKSKLKKQSFNQLPDCTEGKGGTEKSQRNNVQEKQGQKQKQSILLK